MFYNIIRRLVYGYLLNHKTKVDLTEIPIYSFRAEEMKLVTLSTNNMISTPAGYFRFCRCWSDKKNYDDTSKKIFKLLNRGGDLTDNQYNAFIKHESDRYALMNCWLKYDTFSANRSIASYKIASLLGLNNLLTYNEFCWLKIDDSGPLLGTMSKTVSGVGFWDLKGEVRDMVTPSLLRDLSNLEIVDSVCYEPDHGANNYMNILDMDDKIHHICAFDNDNPKDFFPSSNLSNVLTTETKAMVSGEGFFNRKYADAETINKLLSIDKQNIYEQLSPFLNRMQLFYCWKRILLLQKAIRKSLRLKFLVLLNQSEWTSDMVTEEISGRNGRTYMYVLVDWRNYYSKSRK